MDAVLVEVAFAQHTASYMDLLFFFPPHRVLDGLQIHPAPFFPPFSGDLRKAAVEHHIWRSRIHLK